VVKDARRDWGKKKNRPNEGGQMGKKNREKAQEGEKTHEKKPDKGR